MLFYIHYVLMTSGLSGTSVLLAVFFKTYTNASQTEIGALLMSFPFVCLVIKPLFCSMADRRQAHRLFLLLSLIVEMLGYAPFAIIPFFPNFYTNYPRAAWYILVASGHIGSGGLAVGWSLGECLAVNYSQKTGTPFGRMRLMGTLSWGVYGFIIGQINEMPALPKYTPAFFILLSSLALEIVIILMWSNEDFEMVDPLAKLNLTSGDSKLAVGGGAAAAAAAAAADGQLDDKNQLNQMDNYVDSMPSSLGGTLRLSAKTANVFRDVLATDELHRRLKGVESGQHNESADSKSEQQHCEPQQLPPVETQVGNNHNNHSNHNNNNPKEAQQAELGQMNKVDELDLTKTKNPQMILLKMILAEDGRILKYIFLFTIFGSLIAPMNFFFLSYEELCQQRDYNFSQLAGAVLISQALIETLAFLVVPWCLQRIDKSVALSFGFAIVTLKFIFYSGWYYTADISPYWAVLAEWAHGLSYGIFATIQADVSLMFANQSRLFIPELRKLGYLSAAETSTKERIEAEERSIKMALRATMQAIFGGFMDGLGAGAGALLCGLFIEIYSYITVWKLFVGITFATFVLHLAFELSNSRWSDYYKPRKGTKAFEIMQLSRAYEADSSAKSKTIKTTKKVANKLQLTMTSDNKEQTQPKLAESC